MRLLLVEADMELGVYAANRLVEDGHLVDHLDCLEDARALDCDAYDVLIVSWQLSDGSGLAWASALRSQGMKTVIVVLARTPCAFDPFQGAMAAGADDCLVMPTDLDKLCARIRDARLRVSGLMTTRLQCGDVELDLRSRSAYLGGAHVALTGREWNLVEALALRFDRIVPKADLALLVHGRAGSPESAVVEVHLSHVRRKLGRRLIRTVRGAGYRMTA
jgi:two-component system OmpR family response regulator